jgi:hypothetical protein
MLLVWIRLVRGVHPASLSRVAADSKTNPAAAVGQETRIWLLVRAIVRAGWSLGKSGTKVDPGMSGRPRQCKARFPVSPFQRGGQIAL